MTEAIRLPASPSMFPIEEVKPYDRNPWKHTDPDVAKLASGILAFGFLKPIEVDEEGVILCGHRRRAAAVLLGMKEVPVVVHAHLTPAEKAAYRIADNRLTLDGEWDEALLAGEAEEIATAGLDLGLTGFEQEEIDRIIAEWSQDGGGEGSGDGAGAGSLADRFLVPPFTVLNAREGWWQERKRTWIDLGIKSEVGRSANRLGFSDAVNEQMAGGHVYTERAKKLTVIQGGRSQDSGGVLLKSNTTADPGFYAKKRAKEAELGHEISTEEFLRDHYEPEPAGAASGTSIFDPVLCEIAYRWFCPPHGVVFDPFAGGSVRGVVAARLGRRYVGIDLRPEQAEANEEQWAAIGGGRHAPEWLVGDSRDTDSLCGDLEADFVFSCPPYVNLEVYSDDPRDLSKLGWKEFEASYREIIAKACARLLPDRFACFVVGDVRGDDGLYYDFVSSTIRAFRDAGLGLYNEAILVTAVGSLPIRAGRQFAATRKLGKTHQNVLVFVKGDGRRATEACGNVEVAVPDEEQAAAEE